MIRFTLKKRWIIMKRSLLMVLFTHDKVDLKEQLCDLIRALTRKTIDWRCCFNSDFRDKPFFNQCEQSEPGVCFLSSTKCINDFLKFSKLMLMLFDEIADFFASKRTHDGIEVALLN